MIKVTMSWCVNIKKCCELREEEERRRGRKAVCYDQRVDQQIFFASEAVALSRGEAFVIAGGLSPSHLTATKKKYEVLEVAILASRVPRATMEDCHRRVPNNTPGSMAPAGAFQHPKDRQIGNIRESTDHTDFSIRGYRSKNQVTFAVSQQREGGHSQGSPIAKSIRFPLIFQRSWTAIAQYISLPRSESSTTRFKLHRQRPRPIRARYFPIGFPFFSAILEVVPARKT